MSQKKKPFGLNSKAKNHYSASTPRGRTPPKMKLTPMSGVRNSLIPNILDDNDVDWKHRKERSVSPPSSRSPSLPKPTKSEVNMLGFTPNQMYNIYIIVFAVFSFLCYAAADTIQMEKSNTQSSSVLYYFSAISALIAIFLLLFKYCH